MLKNAMINITCIAVLSEVIYQFCRRVLEKYSKRVPENSLTHALIQYYNKDESSSFVFHKVLFFPDPGITCRRTVCGRICRDQNCSAVHKETSLSVLINILKLSKQTVDVCVYMITCSMLAEALVDCQKKGLMVRVITEERNSGEEGEVFGSQIGKLRSSGISVRCRSSSFWMHHKFLIADNEILVNGSFNWTNQAVMGNYENLIITSEQHLVQPFVSEFQRLWDVLAPEEFVAGNALT
ncbi:Mitochondrial cardiolipin hydrolase, partial [Stegodyphus mimosarum]